jgi:hypothetical protein
VDGDSENATVVTRLLAGPVERRREITKPTLLVDGSKT